MIYETALKKYGKDRVFLKENSTLIYYPEALINNEKGEEKKIYDVVICLSIHYDEHFEKFRLSTVPDMAITMTRTTYEYEELEHNYMHSHVFTYRSTNKIEFITENLGKFKRFCLSGNPLFNTFNGIASQTEKTPPKVLAAHIIMETDRLVHSEYATGVPTVRMANCIPFVALDKNPNQIAFRSLMDPIYDLQLDNSYNIKNTDYNMEILKKVYPDYKAMLKGGVWGKPRYEAANNLSEIVRLNTYASGIEFKLSDDVVLTGKIIPSPELDDEVDPSDWSIPPYVFKLISNAVKRKAKNHHIKKLLNEKYSK